MKEALAQTTTTTAAAGAMITPLIRSSSYRIFEDSGQIKVEPSFKGHISRNVGDPVARNFRNRIPGHDARGGPCTPNRPGRNSAFRRATGTSTCRSWLTICSVYASCLVPFQAPFIPVCLINAGTRFAGLSTTRMAFFTRHTWINLSKTTFEFKNQLTLEGGWSFGDVHASIGV